jgi:prevent-host-death family protein
MASVGVRELKEHTSEIVRRVRDDGETIDITYRGEVVATIAPKPRLDPERDRAFWERIDQLRRDIAAHMGPEPVDAVALLDEERMEISPDDPIAVDPRRHS